MQYSYQLFSSESATKPEEENFVTLYKQGESQYMKQSGFETIMSDEFNFMVDHEAKEVMITNGPIHVGSQQLDNLHQKIEGLIKHCGDTSISKKGNVGTILLVCEASTFGKIEVNYSLKDYHIKSLTLYMRKNDLMIEGVLPRIVINYTQVKKGAVLPPNIFEYSSFIERNTEGKLVLKPTYKNYTFSNYLQ